MASFEKRDFENILNISSWSLSLISTKPQGVLTLKPTTTATKPWVTKDSLEASLLETNITSLPWQVTRGK